MGDGSSIASGVGDAAHHLKMSTASDAAFSESLRHPLRLENEGGVRRWLIYNRQPTEWGTLGRV